MSLAYLQSAINEGMNDVELFPHKSGAILTLSHKATPDNTVSLFIPGDFEMVRWSDFFDKEDDALDKAIQKLGA